MKNKIYVYCIFAINLLLYSCQKNEYHIALTRLVEMHLADSIDQYDLIVLIPGSGCTGCITQAEDYFLRNVQNERIKFILTKNHSNKGLSIRLGKSNLRRNNVWIDQGDVFYLEEYEERIYPMVISIRDGRIDKIANFYDLSI